MRAKSVDPIDAQMIRHSLLAIPNLIETNITRTAYSPLIYELKDYAVGIVDAAGRLVSQAIGGIPLFLANALGIAVQDGIAVHGVEAIRPGDVFISNHSGTLGQHLNNVAMYTPIFADANHDRLIGFMAIIVHWLDIGGKDIGSCAPTGTTEIFQEGLHFRSVRLVAQGKPCRDIYSMIELNSRFPEMLLGDVAAQLAGCVMGRDLVADLADRYGLDAYLAAVELMLDQSERSARAAVQSISDGTYAAETLIDNDGFDLDRPIPVRVKVIVAGDTMTIDLSGVAPQVRGSINSGRFGGAMTAARIAFKYLTTPNEPVNEGSFRALEVAVPDGTFLTASATAAMAMYSAPLATVVDTILKAMVVAVPDRVPAGHHATHGIFTISGVDPRTGERFFNLGGCGGGWGATSDTDGSGPYRTMMHGDTYDVPVEVQESLYPIRYNRIGFAEDSGGAGQYRGALGIIREVELLAPATVQINFERTVCPPWGLDGGQDASGPKISVRRRDQDPLSIPKGTIALDRGDVVYIQTSGGGGFGDPERREHNAVLADLRNGYVSPDIARTIYRFERHEDSRRSVTRNHDS